MDRHYDVLIIGAGLSGIGAACHLKARLPGKTFAILEARDAIGGTWDLFRYPGIRSDSDLHTFGYEFKPWTNDRAIAGAPLILDYLRETVEEHGLAPHIRFGHQVLGADWSSRDARWRVRVRNQAEVAELTCGMLFSATGYYDYEAGYRPKFQGEDDFAGQLIHPQHWPDNLDYRDKRVIVIGSGATAVTLIPAMADQTEHITMLQRSPSYVMPLPAKDPIANGLRRVLPRKLAYRITRRINIARQRLIYMLSRRRPALVRRVLRELTKRQLPAGYPVDIHFRPRYDPWDERLCVVPDGDLFKAIRAGTASVVTDRIARLTTHGILLESGRELEADIIVTATGLNMLAFGGLSLSLDGQAVELNRTVAYKGMMLSGVPNFAFAFGYTNSSWTLKIDLVCEHLCRLLAHMDAHGHDTITPVADDATLERRPLLNLQAGYVRRGLHAFPRQGSHGPWTMEMTYSADRVRLREQPIDDPALRFGRAKDAAKADMTGRRVDQPRPGGRPAGSASSSGSTHCSRLSDVLLLDT